MDHELVDRSPPYCRICNGVAGASLPTDCPGVPLAGDQMSRLYRHEIDYRDGDWVDLLHPVMPMQAGAPGTQTFHASVEVELPEDETPPVNHTQVQVVPIPIPIPVPIPVPDPTINSFQQPETATVSLANDSGLDATVSTK
jgi:hypothetical protein